jgi:hypothetical protein
VGNFKGVVAPMCDNCLKLSGVQPRGGCGKWHALTVGRGRRVLTWVHDGTGFVHRIQLAGRETDRRRVRTMAA